MTIAWHRWNRRAIADHTWPNWKLQWMTAFTKMRYIDPMTVGKAAFSANAAEEEHQVGQITASLDNLANASIQKNATINNLVASNTQLSRTCKQQWCAYFPAAKRIPPPTSPCCGCPIHRRWWHHPPLHRPQHRQQLTRVQPIGAQLNPPGTSRATAGPTGIRSRSDTQVQPAPPSVRTTSPAPPKPTLWAGVSTTWGTLSTTAHRLRPQPDNAKQRGSCCR
jgi:hypothetical protein